MYEYRCDERLKGKPEGSTRLVCTGLHGGLEHLKIETRLIGERFRVDMSPNLTLISNITTVVCSCPLH
jgi:hypothetical protein